MDKNKVGLALGVFLGATHLIWSLCVAIIPKQLQSFLNWIFNLHAIKPVWFLTAFSWTNALMLVILTLIVGYVVGWVFAYIHNLLHKK